MKLTQIRNATNRLEYAGTTFLIDRWHQSIRCLLWISQECPFIFLIR